MTALNGTIIIKIRNQYYREHQIDQLKILNTSISPLNKQQTKVHTILALFSCSKLYLERSECFLSIFFENI
jgi:hypothetical protein